MTNKSLSCIEHLEKYAFFPTIKQIALKKNAFLCLNHRENVFCFVLQAQLCLLG